MIRIGPAGWDYPDWVGSVYPKPKPKQFDPLGYIASYFKTVEINSTFYRPASVKVAASWANRVRAENEFRFTAKLWKRFTHERASAFTRAEVKETRAAFDTLADAGRLGAVLLQFPWSFRQSEDNQRWCKDLFAAFAGLPLVVEVRHATWAGTDVLAWLTELGVGLVNLDQPLFKNSLRPTSEATAPVGYIRLHGRNFRDWFRKSASRDERYDYLYSATDLVPWAERIREVASKTEDTYAVTNNHRNGQAPANAEMLESMLEGHKVPAPPQLYARYQRELAPFATPVPR
jgi:uncharacterized protein YecE (DUF72 family)